MLKLDHITCYARSLERSQKFYLNLGLQLKELTTNQHDRETVQANFVGDSGPYLSLLFYPRCQKGEVGIGGVRRITLHTRMAKESRTVRDPDGLEWELIPSDKETKIVGVTCLRTEEFRVNGEVAPIGLEQPSDSKSTQLGYGVVHHVAIRSSGGLARYVYDEFDQLWEIL